MTDLTDVLHRATDDLTPEAPDLLLARAVRRGASLRRRRRFATVSAVGVAAAACVALGLVVTRPLGAAAPTQVTDPVPTPSPTVPTVPSVPRSPQVTVDRDAFGATFARVVSGTITREHDVPADRVHEKGGYESTFDWNGYLVSVQIAPYDGDARSRCHGATDSLGDGQSCVRVPGGWAVHDVTMDDQSLNRWVSVYRDNGFRMWVLIYNSGSEKGTSTGGPPPLDVPDLEQVATSDRWFS